eukprot:TRINITY_DN1791_c0_g1_i3.p1 TRINITY_DN1791_c0_g1~~TRINITY_DN1791_c0_g1_i3.p1  ORF type:complete len:222 (+),score=12.64 TRINITY_DN1791_c0_g1_i3:730-1395(+)
MPFYSFIRVFAVKYPMQLLEMPEMAAFEAGVVMCEGHQNVCVDVFPTAPLVFRFCYNRDIGLGMLPNEREMPWASKLKEWGPSIVILNTGLHLRDEAHFMRSAKNALWFVRDLLPSALIIWRTSAAGHFNCSGHRGAIETPQNPKLWGYNWASLRGRDEKIQAELALVGAVEMNVSHMALFRPDGHYGSGLKGTVDCVHYCRPGPMDTYVLVMFSMLKRLL